VLHAFAKIALVEAAARSPPFLPLPIDGVDADFGGPSSWQVLVMASTAPLVPV